MYSDDEFLLSEDQVNNYKYNSFEGAVLTLTNEEPKEPEPLKITPLYATYDDLAKAIKEGINSIE